MRVGVTPLVRNCALPPEGGALERVRKLHGRGEFCTYAVTLGTWSAAGALGSRGASGAREARSTSNTRSTLQEVGQTF